MVQWPIDNWVLVVTPFLVFLASAIVGLWLRRVAYNAFERWAAKSKWEGSRYIVEATRTPFWHWFLLLGAYAAIQVSVSSASLRMISGQIIGSLFVISLTWMTVSLTGKLIRFYLVI